MTETGNEHGRVADSDTAESHVDLSAFDRGYYDETPQRWRTEWRDGHPVAPRRDSEAGGDETGNEETG